MVMANPTPHPHDVISHSRLSPDKEIIPVVSNTAWTESKDVFSSHNNFFP